MSASNQISGGLGLRDPPVDTSFLSRLFTYRTVPASGFSAETPEGVAVQAGAIISLHRSCSPNQDTSAEAKFYGEVSDYGRTSALHLFVNLQTRGEVKMNSGLLGSGNRADICVWAWTGSPGSVADEFPANQADLGVAAKWALVDARSVTCSTLIRLTELPALPLVVTVSALVGVGDVTMFYRRND